MLPKNNFSTGKSPAPIIKWRAYKDDQVFSGLTKNEAISMSVLYQEYVENEEEIRNYNKSIVNSEVFEEDYKKAVKEHYGITNNDDWFEYIYQQSVFLQYEYNIEDQGWILDDLIKIIKTMKSYSVRL